MPSAFMHLPGLLGVAAALPNDWFEEMIYMSFVCGFFDSAVADKTAADTKLDKTVKLVQRHAKRALWFTVKGPEGNLKTRCALVITQLRANTFVKPAWLICERPSSLSGADLVGVVTSAFLPVV